MLDMKIHRVSKGSARTFKEEWRDVICTRRGIIHGLGWMWTEWDMTHILQIFILCLTYLRHILGFFSSLYFIFTASWVILMLYQLALHVVVKSLLIFSLLISHCFFCFLKITRHIVIAIVLYFYTLPINHSLFPYSSLYLL